MDIDIPRSEYPRPQMVRERWLNLNGRWEFEIDRGDSGLERGLRDRSLAQQILVPFVPESELSGIGDTDFLHAVWYARDVTFPADWAEDRVLLHFGAVDHDATVWVNGTEVVRHRGGWSSFSADITDALTDGRARVVVRARDAAKGPQARGKQSIEYANRACNYTRSTGIWQTVWAEPVPAVHLQRPQIIPDLETATITVVQPVTAARPGHRVVATLRDSAGDVVQAECASGGLSARLVLQVPQDRLRAWDLDDPHLYGLDVALVDATGAQVDRWEGYAGLRSIAIDGHRILLNGKPVFQRLVLDQGWWPQSLLTPPSDEAIVTDLELLLKAGFNGARIHQKVAEERQLYHADRMGVLLWAEYGDWGIRVPGPHDDHQKPNLSFLTEWADLVRRDLSHPSIIGWCPLNETWQQISDQITDLDDVTQAMYTVTKGIDPTRPVLDTSGYAHRVHGADVYDSHQYEQDPARFAEIVGGLSTGEPYLNTGPQGEPWSIPYAGQPYFVSEYGGIWWNPDAVEAEGSDRRQSWGYGQRVRDEEEFQVRFAGLTDVLLDDPLMFGYCYTQLTDVFQEENGIYRFDRSEKLDVVRVARVQRRRAAYEK